MDTIKSSAEISEIFSQGKRVNTPYLTIIYRSRNCGNHEQHDLEGRVAFIAGKKLGNAVWRASAKRRMREICRACAGPWHNFDVIFLAKSAVTVAPYSKVLNACAKAIERCELQ